jgi:hypothetical protein
MRRRSLLSPRTAAAMVAVAAAAGLTDLTAGPAHAAEAGATASCEQVQDPPAQLPAGIEEGDLVFTTQYRAVLVQLTCGRLELTELTGWDACVFLSGADVRRYPC